MSEAVFSFDEVTTYDITLSGGGSGFPTLEKLSVRAAYADACDLAVMLSKHNDADAEVRKDGSVVATLRRATWVKYHGSDGQAILDRSE